MYCAVHMNQYLQGQGQDEDSEAEKLSPLLDVATSKEASDTYDDEIQNTENENDVDNTCHSH